MRDSVDLRFSTVGVVLAICSIWAASASATEGYFKDLFIDGGAWLTGRQTLAAAEHLGLSFEALALPYEPTDEHIRIQNEKIVGTEDDTNGCLLYPDGAPRFRLVQTNGGSATRHGRTLGEEGRQRVRDFYYGGGSYTGTCAGFFIATVAAYDDGVNENYYHIWPGRPRNTGLLSSYTGMFIEPGSPLLEYYDFGGDDYVADVYHNGGGYAEEDHPEWPDGTEILARFDYSGRSMHEQVSCLAYKEDDRSGRLVIIGSHPEGVASGERRDLMAAMMLYALDGQGEVQVKGALEPGVPRLMDRYWEDDDPLYARIGDRQYHHFTVDVPAGATELSIELSSDEGYDLDLYARFGDLAFESAADAESESPSATERISIASPEPGRWYVGVHCYASVVETAHDWYVEYSGDLGVLNGVAYTVAADYEVLRELIVAIPERLSESQGAVGGTIRAAPAPAVDLTIQLEASEPSRLSVPASVLIAAGRDQADFELAPVDNGELDGDVEVSVVACAEGYDCTFATVVIADDEVPPSDPSCGELGGACCPTGDECEGGESRQAWDCEGTCCVGGTCVAPQEDPTRDDEPPAGDVVGGFEVTRNDGCSCQSSVGGGATGAAWIFVVIFALGLRRSACGARLADSRSAARPGPLEGPPAS